MTDIVERLRDVKGWCHVSTVKEAADEIERLRAALAEHEHFPSQQEIDDAAQGLADYVKEQDK